MVNSKDKTRVKGCILEFKDRHKPFMYQINLGKSEDGKRLRESRSFRTRKEAEKALNARIMELDESMPSPEEEDVIITPSSDTRVADYIKYVLDLGITKAKARTRENYYKTAKYIVRPRSEGGIGDMRLSDLSDENVLRFLNSMRDYGQATLDSVYVVTNMIFRYAYKKRLLKENIMEYVYKPVSYKPRKKVEAYSDEEYNLILEKAKDYPEVWPFLIALDRAGVRPGEMRAMKWKNLDWENKTIYIDSAITIEASEFVIGGRANDRKEVVGPTKSAAGYRKIPLTDVAIKALRDWRKYIDRNPAFKNARNEEFIFTCRKGGFIKESALMSKFRRFLESSGLLGMGFTMYRFRHTFCTRLMRNKTALPYVQALMGDSTIDVIVKNYSTVDQSDLRNAIYEVEKHAYV